MFTREWFFDLESGLRLRGLDSDSASFDDIKKNLSNPKKLNPTEFAHECIYVILAGGFSQKTAKKKHSEIIGYLKNNIPDKSEMLNIFNNQNKINAIIKIWNDKDNFCNNYYVFDNTQSRVLYLSKLPHIGKITANHLARNLGENIVKYDIWIQRLGVVYAGKSAIASKIDNGKLDADIKISVDKMFDHLEKQTGFPRGYIDVVLWRACQNKLVEV